MPNLHVVGRIHETTQGGLYGTVTLPDGRVWVLHGRRIVEASPDAEPVERPMEQADVLELERIGAIDGKTATRQIMRVLK